MELIFRMRLDDPKFLDDTDRRGINRAAVARAVGDLFPDVVAELEEGTDDGGWVNDANVEFAAFKLRRFEVFGTV